MISYAKDDDDDVLADVVAVRGGEPHGSLDSHGSVLASSLDAPTRSRAIIHPPLLASLGFSRFL